MDLGRDAFRREAERLDRVVDVDRGLLFRVREGRGGHVGDRRQAAEVRQRRDGKKRAWKTQSERANTPVVLFFLSFSRFVSLCSDLKITDAASRGSPPVPRL